MPARPWELILQGGGAHPEDFGDDPDVGWLRKDYFNSRDFWRTFSEPFETMERTISWMSLEDSLDKLLDVLGIFEDRDEDEFARRFAIFPVDFTEARYCPTVVCKDGFRISAQANVYMSCLPRGNVGPYTRVEVSGVSGYEPILQPWGYGYYQDHTPEDRYYNVPAEIVLRVIMKHGGMVSGGLPPLRVREVITKELLAYNGKRKITILYCLKRHGLHFVAKTVMTMIF